MLQLLRVSLFLLLASLAGVTPVAAQKAILMVRHAERVDESVDAALSEAGLRRAETLAAHLAAAGVSAIYTTQYQRTIKTAEPLARRLKLTMVSGAATPAELVRTLKAQHPSDVVLVVGHSNTIPDILAQLGHPDKVEIGPQQFDDLFVVVPRASGAPAVVRLKY
jgi:broad specificity phosphatase PhoE